WPFKRRQRNDPNDPVPPYTPPYDPTMEPFIQGISSASPETRMEIYRQLIEAGYSHAAASSFLEHHETHEATGGGFSFLSRCKASSEELPSLPSALQDQSPPAVGALTLFISSRTNFLLNMLAEMQGSSSSSSAMTPYPASVVPPSQHSTNHTTLQQQQQQGQQQQQQPFAIGVEEYEAALLDLVLKRSAEEARMRAAEEADNEAAIAALLASTALESRAWVGARGGSISSLGSVSSNGIGDEPARRPFSVSSSFSIPTDHGEGPSLSYLQNANGSSPRPSGSSSSSTGGSIRPDIPVVGTISVVPLLNRTQTIPPTLTSPTTIPTPTPLTPSTPVGDDISVSEPLEVLGEDEELQRRLSSKLASIIAGVIGMSPLASSDPEAAAAAANAIAERITRRDAVQAANAAAEAAIAAAAVAAAASSSAPASPVEEEDGAVDRVTKDGEEVEKGSVESYELDKNEEEADPGPPSRSLDRSTDGSAKGSLGRTAPSAIDAKSAVADPPTTPAPQSAASITSSNATIIPDLPTATAPYDEPTPPLLPPPTGIPLSFLPPLPDQPPLIISAPRHATDDAHLDETSDPLWELDKMEEKEWAEAMRMRMKEEIEREMRAEAARALEREKAKKVGGGGQPVPGFIGEGFFASTSGSGVSEVSSDGIPLAPPRNSSENSAVDAAKAMKNSSPPGPSPLSDLYALHSHLSKKIGDAALAPLIKDPTPPPAPPVVAAVPEVDDADEAIVIRRREIMEMLERERKQMREELEKELELEREKVRREEAEKERVRREEAERERIKREEAEKAREEFRALLAEKNAKKERDEKKAIREAYENVALPSFLEKEGGGGRESFLDLPAISPSISKSVPPPEAGNNGQGGEVGSRFATMEELFRGVERGITLTGEEASLLREYLFERAASSSSSSSSALAPEVSSDMAPPVPAKDSDVAMTTATMNALSQQQPLQEYVPTSRLIPPSEYTLKSMTRALPAHLTFPSATVVEFDPKRMTEISNLDSFLYRAPGIPSSHPATLLPAFSVLSNHPLTKSSISSTFCAYFEVTLASADPDAVISVGLVTDLYPSHRCPGWHPTSVAYLSSAERVHCVKEWSNTTGADGAVAAVVGPGTSHQIRSPFGMTFSAGDTIGCGYIPAVGGVFFTLNGEFLGEAFSLLGAPPDAGGEVGEDGESVISFHASVGCIAPLVSSSTGGRVPGGDGCTLVVNFGADPAMEFAYAAARAGAGGMEEDDAMSRTSMDSDVERALAASLETSAAEAAKAAATAASEEAAKAAAAAAAGSHDEDEGSAAGRKRTWDSNARGSSIFMGRSSTTSTRAKESDDGEESGEVVRPVPSLSVVTESALMAPFHGGFSPVTASSTQFSLYESSVVSSPASSDTSLGFYDRPSQPPPPHMTRTHQPLPRRPTLPTTSPTASTFTSTQSYATSSLAAHHQMQLQMQLKQARNIPQSWPRERSGGEGSKGWLRNRFKQQMRDGSEPVSGRYGAGGAGGGSSQQLVQQQQQQGYGGMNRTTSPPPIQQLQNHKQQQLQQHYGGKMPSSPPPQTWVHPPLSPINTRARSGSQPPLLRPAQPPPTTPPQLPPIQMTSNYFMMDYLMVGSQDKLLPNPSVQPQPTVPAPPTFSNTAPSSPTTVTTTMAGRGGVRSSSKFNPMAGAVSPASSPSTPYFAAPVPARSGSYPFGSVASGAMERTKEGLPVPPWLNEGDEAGGGRGRR
ncbi:Rsp5p-dependent ubiquitination, sorting of cargo proteins at the multivesicular body, partial [Dinochytrium kinnereticum]